MEGVTDSITGENLQGNQDNNSIPKIAELKRDSRKPNIGGRELSAGVLCGGGPNQNNEGSRACPNELFRIRID